MYVWVEIGRSGREDPEEITTVDVHAAKHLTRSGHCYLDVRTEEEFKKGHVDVENPLNIPYMFNTPQGTFISFI